MNDNRLHNEYRQNYKTLFGLKLPNMDTVDDLLKKDYKRLPICIPMDGLYANQPTMKAIKTENNWEFIIVWKDKTLYRLQEEVAQHREQNLVKSQYRQKVQNQYCRTEKRYEYSPKPLRNITCPIYYSKLEEDEIEIRAEKDNKTTKFVFKSSIPVTSTNYKELINVGRLQWKIIMNMWKFVCSALTIF